MSEEPAEPRARRGEALDALVREDLDLYAVSDLQARIAALEEEIARVRVAVARKSTGRSAADALFSFKP
jgi:uncharacterized small protein (DUF1192 family)